jgi:acyl-CoA hydrolase
MISDGVVDLVESGAITGAYKPLDRGKVVATFAAGTQRLYDFLHDNPGVTMRPVDYTNSTQVIRRHPRMVAVNSAIQVDLTGQVCADSIGYTIYSGVGGQMDFVRGAALSEGGKAIIALPSTARHDSISRIVPALSEGAGVVTTRAHVQFIVTEYGVADLRGRSLRERAAALIGVSHPAFRAQLAEAAERQRRASGAPDS